MLRVTPQHALSPLKRLVWLLLLIWGAPATCTAQTPWLTYHVYPGELALHSDTPKVAVFSDGRVQVSRLAWQPRPGLYEYRLEPAALDALVAAATAPELATIDLAVAEQALAETRQRLAHEQQRFYAISDPDRYQITVSSGAAPRSRTPGAGRIELVWERVHPAVETTAGIPARQRLADLRTMLEELATTKGARRIADAPSIEENPQ